MQYLAPYIIFFAIIVISTIMCCLFRELTIHHKRNCSPKETAVTAFSKSKVLLLFAFVWQRVLQSVMEVSLLSLYLLVVSTVKVAVKVKHLIEGERER